MAPKSSSSKKSSGSPTTADAAKVPKFKLPVQFIARPLNNKDYQNACVAVIHPKVLKELQITAGSICAISKIGSNAIAVQAKAGDEDSLSTNVILLSAELRAVGNIILGDRLELRKMQKQPLYSSKVTIGSLEGEEITDPQEQKRITKLLDDCGLVMPGLSFKNFLRGETDSSISVLITDVEDTNLPNISKVSLQDSIPEDDVFYLSPPVIFQRGSTSVIFTKANSVSSKYHLPEPVTYNSVGGLFSEIEILKNTIELPLRQPQLFTDFGVTPPRGIMLHGPPGTGKTMILRCVAHSTNAHVLTIDGPSIVSKYLGETEATLRDIFNEAVKYQPSIVFIDEIDSIAPNRANDDSGEAESRVVATLLTLMDGMGASGKVVVIGATNRPNSVDPALRRPGRFDQEVEIGIPDAEARLDILHKQFQRMSSDRQELTEEDIKTIASKTHGYVGADLSALCREAVMKTIQRGINNTLDREQLKVTMLDLENAMLEVRPSAMREIFLEMPKVYWSDIGGQDELKRKLKEMIQLPLDASETFARLGVSAPKGVLLYGPPGCSKTLTAKALATESGLNFLAVKGPEIFNKYVGESERAIREIFRKARAASPSIIFFDEIDALSPDRDGESTSAANHVLTSLLNEIDGVEELNGVVIVAATNRPDEIDPALLRPGRLDRHIYVGPPDYDARLQILRKCTSKFNIESSGVDLEALAQKTDGCSGAEVVLLCQEAGLASIMENVETEKVSTEHFEKALRDLSRGITLDMLEYYQAFALKSGVTL
ncbi:AAA family ATPase AFG2 KNAG_0B06160 [Huiozyma naganishii CBS 8797]|uniref:AAA+ ATPase domain-containing protein n=1 Tax=Huiozyma naganishii (strain ATCC MYA-139 / BCRC 22969 / CBS 8797 / KCTC 17520 / NBRC 10181 / NCYC 3082 / Yp74L-3) TaxID=1071383 RepID=J7S5B6_HUIN7|nr:hypothetical protein KNAG_0B06160 [Kazachstania naganishii CBS 8797]CCK69046.1 hypothetical protein KNAG_0B06160 [Kazachstania naganishii CBS 8797]